MDSEAIENLSLALARLDQAVTNANGRLSEQGEAMYRMQRDIAANTGTATATASSLAARKPPVRYLTPFANDHNNKKENWVVFRRQFLIHVQSQGYGEPEAKGCLMMSLTGDAALAANTIEMDEFETVRDLLDELEKKFMPAASSALAQTNFEQAVQKAGESVLDWHSRLFSMWKRAYPNITDNHILIRRFTMGISHMETRKELLRQRPTNYDVALEIAQTEEAVCKATRSTAMNQAIMPAPTVDEPMDISAIGKQSACHECGQTGHFRRECPKLKTGTKTLPKWKKKGTFGKSKGAPRSRTFRRKQLKQMINTLEAEIDCLPSSGEESEEEEGQEEETSSEEPDSQENAVFH
jgi:hypothetical protein